MRRARPTAENRPLNRFKARVMSDNFGLSRLISDLVEKKNQRARLEKRLGFDDLVQLGVAKSPERGIGLNRLKSLQIGLNRLSAKDFLLWGG